MSDDRSLDILGVKPIGESVKKITDVTADGASSFLSKICMPAAEEFGLLLKDKVCAWRANNAIAIANKAKALLEPQVKNLAVHAPPRLVHATIEHGSWFDEDEIQNMWAGLLTSSCSQDGKDDGNIILISLLSQLTSSQVRLINYIGNHAKTYQSTAGWIGAEPLFIEADDLKSIMLISDIYQIDRELDHLRGLELIKSGFRPDSLKADVSPHALCLHLYVKCLGFIGSPNEYFNPVTLNNIEIQLMYRKYHG